MYVNTLRVRSDDTQAKAHKPESHSDYTKLHIWWRTGNHTRQGDYASFDFFSCT